jgi:hypothetical protein
MAYDAAARKRNLQKANDRRAAIKQMREALKAGELDPFPLLAGDCGEWEAVAKRLKISVVLKMIPGIGPVTRDELLGELGVTSDVRFNALTYERRAALAALVNAVLDPGTDLQLPAT